MYDMLLKISLTLVFFANLCIAWGPRFESGTGRRFAFQSAMVANENHHPEHEDALIVETSIDLHDLIYNAHHEVREILDFVSERADQLAAETFTEHGIEQCIGDDCDVECLIPEEWTRISGEVDTADVMNFLGIQRVRPLRKPMDWE